MADRIIEGYWDCKYCGKNGIGGLTKTCPSCGHPQDGDVKFYLQKDKHYITGEQAKKAQEGPDWVCAFCGNLNSNREKNCRGCGAERKDAKSDYFGRKPGESDFCKSNNEEHSHSYYEREAVERRNQEEKERQKNAEARDEHTKSFDNHKSNDGISNYPADSFVGSGAFFKGLAVCLAIILLVTGLVMLFYPKEYTAVVEATYWERTIRIDEWKTVAESGWSVPTGGRVYRQAEEFYEWISVFDHNETKTRQESRQVLDHYDTQTHYSYSDNGNGTFTQHEYTTQTPVYKTEYYTVTYQEPVYRQEDVYKTKYYYHIDKWVYNRTEKASGENETDAYWPEYTLAENEKVAGQSEKYKIYLKTEKKEYSCSVSEEEWKSYPIGTEVTITVSAGIVTKVGTVEVSENTLEDQILESPND